MPAAWKPPFGARMRSTPARPTSSPACCATESGRRLAPKVPSQAIQSAGVAFRKAAVFDCTYCIAITWQALLNSTASEGHDEDVPQLRGARVSGGRSGSRRTPSAGCRRA